MRFDREPNRWWQDNTDGKVSACRYFVRRLFIALLAVLLASAGMHTEAFAQYVGSASASSANPTIQSAALEILGNGGGAGTFNYKGGGNAIDAAVAAALAACVVDPGNCSLGGYGGHMMIWKSGADGDPQKITCIDFGTAAGSLASPNMFVGSLNPTNGHWTGVTPEANLYGWKAVGVPGTFAGLYMAQTNYGREDQRDQLLSFRGDFEAIVGACGLVDRSLVMRITL